jgi:hypothetical protein
VRYGVSHLDVLQVTMKKNMEVLVSLCNRSPQRFEGWKDSALLGVNVCTGAVRVIPLACEWIGSSCGITGIASRGDGGYVCMLPPSALLYLSSEFKPQNLYNLTKVRDGHSVVWKEGRCYLASTGTDTIVEFSPDRGESVFWSGSDTGVDTIHLNSLLWDDSGCWITAFGPKSGPLWKMAASGYVMNVFTGERLMSGLYHPHSIVRDADGTFYMCESSRMKVRSTGIVEIENTRGYLRGLCVTSGYIVVGSTKGRKRSKSTETVVDNSADPGEPAGQPGLSVYRRAPAGIPSFERFIDLEQYADELYDVVAVG